MNISKMNLTNLTSSLLILTSFFCVQSAPAKPLNERSTELTWQAWLLVDDQNQNKQYDPEALIRRRITPKSVFIAPTFSPESLPDCADGYTSDSMGRCIKIIELDKDAHLDFILHRLNQQFGAFEEYEDYDDEPIPTPGPFQFNIPLGEVNNENAGDDQTNVAIVVAPTNGNFGLSKNDTSKVKKDDKNKTSQVDVPIIVTKINIDEEQNDQTTEIPTTTEAVTTEIPTTELPTTTELPETTTNVETTTILQQALFFKVPNDSTIEEMFKPEKTEVKSEPKLQEIISQLLPHANIKTKFDESLDIFSEFNSAANHQYKNRDTNHQAAIVSTPETKQVFNHRNRDKHWQFPTSWKDVPPQKPLVYRFSNLPANKHTSNFYHHPRQEGVYREVPPEDLSYIFGFKRAIAHR